MGRMISRHILPLEKLGAEGGDVTGEQSLGSCGIRSEMKGSKLQPRCSDVTSRNSREGLWGRTLSGRSYVEKPHWRVRCRHGVGGWVLGKVRKGIPWNRPYRKGILRAALGTASLILKATFLPHPPPLGMVILSLPCEN